MNAVVKIDGKPSLIATLAARFGVESDRMLATLKATAFKGDVTTEQMMALCIVANQYGLNPWTKEIYAFPDKQNGIVPVVGLDGWSRLINSNHEFDGMEFIESETTVEDTGTDDAPKHKPCPAWIECRMYRKDRKVAIPAKEKFAECYRPPFKNSYGKWVNGPWQSHTSRMLRHKAMIQAARLAFGFVGIYDPDEADRIIDVTPPLQGNPRDGMEAADPIKVDEYVARINEIIEADVEEEPRADMIFALHQEINAQGAETYSAVYDAMAARKVLTKKGWDAYKVQGSKQFQQRNAEGRR
jgi:phage recombination protein Bet